MFAVVPLSTPHLYPTRYPHFHLSTSPVRILVCMYFHEISLNKFCSAISVTSVLCCVSCGHWCRGMAWLAVKLVWQSGFHFRNNCKKGCNLDDSDIGWEGQCTCIPYCGRKNSKIQEGAHIRMPFSSLLDNTLIAHMIIAFSGCIRNSSPSHCLLFVR